MDELSRINFIKNYKAPTPSLWKGRSTPIDLGMQYWYQAITFIDLSSTDHEESNNITPDIGIVSYACDEGVRRNLGRVGAQMAPDIIKTQLAKSAFHHRTKTIADFGEISCTEGDMEASQQALAFCVELLLKQNTLPLVIGGGHDVAFGHIQGLNAALQQRPNNKIGIINFDAHFDLRPVETLSNSGTPFNQALEQFGNNIAYFALGIQPASNTPSLFEIAKLYNVDYIMYDECTTGKIEHIKERLAAFIKHHDHLYITIDLDGYSSAYAPGVSAPSPFGFDPSFVLSILEFLIKSQKVISVDIAEYNPSYDKDHCTANLAAKTIDYIIGQL